MSKPAAKQPDPTITPAEMRVELAIDGLRSLLAANNLAMATAAARRESLLEQILKAIENQTKLLTGANGHARHDAHVNE